MGKVADCDPPLVPIACRSTIHFVDNVDRAAGLSADAADADTSTLGITLQRLQWRLPKRDGGWARSTVIEVATPPGATRFSGRRLVRKRAVPLRVRKSPQSPFMLADQIIVDSSVPPVRR